VDIDKQPANLQELAGCFVLVGQGVKMGLRVVLGKPNYGFIFTEDGGTGRCQFGVYFETTDAITIMFLRVAVPEFGCPEQVDPA